VEFVSLGRLVAELLGLLVQELERVVLGDLLALGGLDVVARPLPQLAARDLGRRGVFHQVVDGDAADAADPGFHVAESDVEVLADSLFGDLTGDVHVEQVVGGDVHVFAAHVHLVGRGHVRVEDVGGDGGERWVSDPGAVVAGADLTELVGANLCHGGVIGLLVVLDGDLSGHTTHGVDGSLVAGLDEQLDVCVHEGTRHGDGVSVGQDEVGVLAEALDCVEDVVPATAVETGGVVTELVDDLIVLAVGSLVRLF
jgi:hypothetical protein